jgi:predicted membrane protein
MQRDHEVTHRNYFWAIMIPGAICGAIVGFATQRYGKAPAPAAV